MSIQAYQLSGAGQASIPNPTISSVRSPTTTDIISPAGNPYSIGQYWENTVSAILFVYLGGGVWDQVGSGSGGPVDSLSDDSSTKAFPAAGNIQIAGTANQVATTTGANKITLSLIGPYTPATYTAHGVLLGEGTSSIVATAAGTDGQVLTANTGADPSFVAIGTKSGLTAHGVVLAEGTSAFAATAAGATGTVLAGITSADPAFHAISELNIVDNTTGTVGAPTTIVVNTTYVADEASVTTGFILPATAALGDRFTVVGNGPGGWRIAQNASQAIKIGGSTSTTGTGGSVSSTSRYDSITLVAVVSGASTIWATVGQAGTFSIV